MTLNKEDYLEQECLLCMNKKRIELKQIYDKVDFYFSKKEIKSVEKLLLYWVDEAFLLSDYKGLISLCNELIGYYRKYSTFDKAKKYIDLVLNYLEKEKETEQIIAATTYLNIGTCYKSFEKNSDAKKFYEKALIIYEEKLTNDDLRLSALYNNYALVLVSLKNFELAITYYKKALAIHDLHNDSILDKAITYLNLADLLFTKDSIDYELQIDEYVKKSMDLLNDSSLKKDGYYAFVCEKCASGFDFFGYFRFANELRKRAKDIYERP